MILLTLAAAALTQWTGPRTVEYTGPGNYCGGGYVVRLARGDRALDLPQGHGGAQATRLVLAGREVNVWNGARRQGGQLVMSFPGGSVTQQGAVGGVTYTISDETPYGLQVTSEAFRGFRNDRWFFSHANFRSDAEQGIDCLAAYSN